MRRILQLAITLCSVCIMQSAFAHMSPPTGFWLTLDDDQKQSSIIEICDTHGTLSGRIVKIFPQEGQNPSPVCKNCPGEYRNKPLLGLTILWGLQAQQGEWTGGQMLSPKRGEIVKASARQIDNDTLNVRGYKNAFVGKTVTWKRTKNPNTPKS